MNLSQSSTFSITDSLRNPSQTMDSRAKQQTGVEAGEPFGEVYQTQAGSFAAESGDNRNDYNMLKNTEGSDSTPQSDQKNSSDRVDVTAKDEQERQILLADTSNIRTSFDATHDGAMQGVATEEAGLAVDLFPVINLAYPAGTASSKVGENIPADGNELPLSGDLFTNESQVSRHVEGADLLETSIKVQNEQPLRGHSDSKDGGSQADLRKSIDPTSVQTDSRSQEAKLGNPPHKTLADTLPDSHSFQLSRPGQEQGNRLSSNATTMSNQPTSVAQVDSQAMPKLNLGIEGLTRSNAEAGIRTTNPDWSNTIGEKVHWMRNANVSTAELHLHPAELGSIEIKIITEDQQTRVSFVTSSAAARDVIESSMSKLRDLLADGGLSLEQSDISHRDSEKQQAQNKQHALSENRPLEHVKENSFIAPPPRSRLGQVDQYV